MSRRPPGDTVRDVDVVIVTYQSAASVAGALAGVEGCGRIRSTVVVDNASPDDSAERSRAAGADVVIENADNLGFAAAVNRALAASEAPYVLLLNPDAQIDPGSLEALADALDDDPRAVIAAPVLVGEDGRIEIGARRFSTVTNRLLWHLPMPWRPEWATPEYAAAGRMRAAAPQPVDYVWGAALLARRAFLDDIGGLDKRFFLYSEDEDLGRQARVHGRTVLLVPRARAHHAGGASTPDRALALARIIAANALLLEKWEGPSAAYVYRRLIGPVLAARSFLLRAARRDVEAELAHRAGRLLRDRRAGPAVIRKAKPTVSDAACPGLSAQALGYAIGTVRLAARVSLAPAISGPQDPRSSGTSQAPGIRLGHARSDVAPGTIGDAITEDTPLVSVILPVHDAASGDASYLSAALASVAAQGDPCMELIVVDDGSTDDTSRLVETFLDRHAELPARLVHKPNGGQSSARNWGARASRGAWLAFLDQDDVWTDDHLSVVRPYLKTGVDVVYTDADTIDEAGRPRDVRIHQSLGLGGGHPKECVQEAIYENAFVMPGVMTVRRDFFDAVGGFDEGLAGYEDDDLFVRCLESGRLSYVPTSTLRWRIHPASASHTQRMVDSGLLYWRKLMDRYATGEDAAVIARRLSLRFARIFLSDASRQLVAGSMLFERNLEAAEQVMPYLGRVDRAAFAATRWGWRSTSFPARCARSWFLNGLGEATA